MIDYITHLVFILGYLFLTYFAFRAVVRKTAKFSPLTRSVIHSFAYALIFGIGLAGGGGDPGFAIPCPIIIAGLFDIFVGINIINGVILPLLFWWFIILTIMSIRRWRGTKSEE